MSGRPLLPVLSALVLALAGCGSDSDDNAATAPAAGTVAMTDYAFDPSELDVRTGQTIRVVNEGGIAHNLKIEKGPDGRRETDELAGTDTFLPEDSQSLTIDLPPGRYAMVCTVPGHRELGMTGKLRVR
jgi:plastocyanin